MMAKLTAILCLNIVTLFSIIYSAAALKYVPPSREIDVEEMGEYTFGVTEDGTTYITRCSYETDTGIRGSFDVNKGPRSTSKLEAKNIFFNDFNIQKYQKTGQFFKTNEAKIRNEITNNGNRGYCTMTIKRVDETGPTKWTLRPYDKYIGATLPPITYKVNFFYKTSLVKDQIVVYEHASFMNHLNVSRNIKLQSCILKFNDTTVDLDLRSSKAISSTTYSLQHKDILKHLSSLGQGLCGFKYIKATKEINGLEWTLSATDNQGKSYRGSFKTLIMASISEEILHKKVVLFMGDSYSITCGDKTFDDFCYLFNPAGKLIETQGSCEFRVETFTMDNIGVWKCYRGSKLSMETTEYTIELVSKDPATITTWVNETDDYVNMGCQLVNYNHFFYPPNYCKMIIPNQQVLILQSFTATDRYLSIGTDLSNGVCSLQIKKPLKEFEKGMWRCELPLGNGDVTGAVLEVNKPRNTDYPKRLELTTRLGKPFTVSCKVPYSSQYCSIRAPNGTEYIDKRYFHPHVGRCSFIVDKATHSDKGTWICSFARKTGTPDDKIMVEVIIAEYLTHDNLVTVNAGSPAKMMCSSNGLPLKYCRFIHPNGSAYHIHNRESSTRISYYGRGLEYGECGIEISKTLITDHGYWTCATQISSTYASGELSGEILVIVAPSAVDGKNLQARRIKNAAQKHEHVVLPKRYESHN